MKRTIHMSLGLRKTFSRTVEVDIPDGISTEEYDKLCDDVLEKEITALGYEYNEDIDVDMFDINPPVVRSIKKLPPPPDDAYFMIGDNRYVTDGGFLVRDDVQIPTPTIEMFGRHWRKASEVEESARVIFEQAVASDMYENRGMYDPGYADILRKCNKAFRVGPEWCMAWVDERGVAALVMSTTPGYADERKLCDWRGLPVNGGEK